MDVKTPDEELLRAYGGDHSRSRTDLLTDLRAVRDAINKRWEVEAEYHRRKLVSSLRLSENATWLEIEDVVRIDASAPKPLFPPLFPQPHGLAADLANDLRRERRDLFAAHAMQALLPIVATVLPRESTLDENFRTISRRAFALADAMLKASEEK